MAEPIAFLDFASLVAETFDVPGSSIVPDTVPDDVPGWDSLGHSVLLSRLDRRWHLGLGEADASPPATVGDLHARLSAIAVRVPA